MSEQQDQLQPGVWDIALSRLYLWQYDGGTRPSRLIHQWAECWADQPDSTNTDWVLPGALSG